MDLLVVINVNTSNNDSCLVPLLFKWSVFAGFELIVTQVDVLESDWIILATGKCHAKGRIWTFSSAIKGLANKMNLASWSGRAESALELGCLPHSGDIPPVNSRGQEWQDQLTVFYGGAVNSFCAGDWLCYLNHTEHSKQVMMRRVHPFNWSCNRALVFFSEVGRQRVCSRAPAGCFLCELEQIISSLKFPHL